MKKQNPHTIKVSSQIKNNDLTLQYLDTILAPYQVNERLRGCIDLALIEAFNNAILHGNKLDPAKNVTISIQINKNILTLIVQDEGEGFKFDEKFNDPTLPCFREKESGRGLYLMKTLADKLTVKKATITMEFDLSKQPND